MIMFEPSLYEAEDDAREWCGEDGPALTPAAIPAFVRDVMLRAGWTGGGQPTIAFDVADQDDERAGWHEGATGVIHLHPALADAWLVLHEVAHWLRPTDGHGPQFAAVLASLVRAGISEAAGEALADSFEDHGIDVDPDWLRAS